MNYDNCIAVFAKYIYVKIVDGIIMRLGHVNFGTSFRLM